MVLLSLQLKSHGLCYPAKQQPDRSAITFQSGFLICGFAQSLIILKFLDFGFTLRMNIH
jgi:hypothetical protein